MGRLQMLARIKVKPLHKIVWTTGIATLMAELIRRVDFAVVLLCRVLD